MSKPDGYRYVRQYVKPSVGPVERWGLFEVREGRARRVGTAASAAEYRAFLAREAQAGSSTEEREGQL